MRVSVVTVLCLLVACSGIILTIKMARHAVKHRAIRILLLFPLVTTLAAGGLFLFAGAPGRHRLGPQVWPGSSSPSMALRSAAVSAREFARDRIDDGRSAAREAKVILNDKAEALRHSVAVQEYEATLTAEESDDCDDTGGGLTAVIHRYGSNARASNWRIVTGSALWSLIAAAAVGAFLYVGYILLDASTRGHFSWPLRLAAVGGFGVIYAALTLLRH